MSDYLSKDEISNIVMAFKEMDLKPCAQTPDDFKTWMADYKDTDDDLWNAYLPRISAFSGDAKTGTPYDLWRYEVQCLIKTGHTHETITMAIRRSLRGDASKVPMRLGPEATIDDIIDKMDSVYGSVDQPEALLGQFYTARQQDDEDVATWACRLEEILSKAKNRKNVTEENINDMLTSKFFDGLRPEMKNTITDFHSLLKATREIENQHNLKPSLKKKPPTHATTTSTTTTVKNRQIQQLTALVKQLSQDVKALKEDRNCDQPSTNIQWSEEIHHGHHIIQMKQLYIDHLVQPVAYGESLSHQPDALDNMPNMLKEHQINIRDEQMNDSTIRYWIDKVSREGNADDDQDRTEEHSELEEDASLREESGGSEHETSLDDQVYDLATDALHDVTDDDSKEDENIDDDGEDVDDISTPEPQQRRSTRTKTSTATTKYKDFVVPPVSKSAQPEWMVRADYLRTAASSGMFINMADDVSRAFLKLITKPDD
ncbi:unnamed protein product [Mytilus edulis]|uniref:Paraneoplastic antigen Ma-like C-terminal domain-containing protein n=1 Tax=Mytilus edulis TaxID=6550 RepID=A0A8S3QH31_MYTED|nr:unnamed protein product [Mytilus edulis]